MRTLQLGEGNMTNLIADRLAALRRLMHEMGVDYYYVPSSDPHKNEYVPSCWQRRAWISGFTGSAGDVVVGIDKAFLWTDPRYFLQAEQQLDDSLYHLMKMGQGETPAIDQWLTQQRNGIVFAVDPRLINLQQSEKIQRALEKQNGKLLALDENLIDRVWKDQPPLPQSAIQLQPLQYAGLSAEDKLAALRQTLQKESADAIVLNTLDAIAWLFNIRGNDVAYNPLVISYAVITQNEASLFVDPHKITEGDRSYFKKIPVHIEPYEGIGKLLESLSGSVWLDPGATNLWLRDQLKNTASLILKPSPITLAKALKNPVEQKGAREAHIIDAIAMIQFLHWLENHWQSGVSEISAAEKLEFFRRGDSRCLDLSFPSISGFGPHGAIVHYSATTDTDATINDSAPYLIDSGGQYHYGTTDITRTIHLGTPTEEEKRLYTLVLKGHLAIRQAVFPKGTCGEHLNALAHQFLWREALDCGHGTGHGVGSYLCVHEGPQAITSRYTGIPLQPGMIVSNEPGVYLTHKYGIRIENLCLVTEKFTVDDSLTGDGPFYSFEDLTLVPYCRKLINPNLLTSEEIQQINDYHQRVDQTLRDLLPANELNDWLHEATAPL
ncbi:aminopeptidase P family protein [Coxiella burnetii]|uniref:Xaa-Pro aminopeptidase n=1 Tax=Coxiella burnetii (strain Dugway 5J108-111) TaxID=434922 RepID=A9KGV2_COXBN|nr:aminopeptidase P family protein [Coxiella burnetii]ABS77369.2 Xaa-Pro aminopeptidase [Coxiella burnetii Dugway 5J108-111]OYK79498.1 aminopeptidase P family protein [Coxiella burnetii]OYK81579.1 aminopeptidase P family protein [Coxiella burnetii]